jgi:hypothetical protein
MIKVKTLKSFGSVSTLFIPFLLCVFAWSALVFGQTAAVQSATVEDIRAFFKTKQKTVLTFVGVFRCRIRG